MHPKNPFKKEYDFDTLIKHEMALEQYVFVNNFGNQTIPFSNKQAVKALNSALLNFNYGLEWDIPKNNLCPPIPGRIDYLLHINDLVNKEKVRMLDIGTGANLIYPILGTCHFNWDCVASEIDPDSIKNAEKLIEKNPSLKNIELRKQIVSNNILVNIIMPEDKFDVVVCNPPFFKNAMDAQDKNQRKVKNLKLKDNETLNFGGLSNELWYKGGEESFVIKMAIESVKFKSQVKWFTSLVSQKYNLKNILRVINKVEPTEVKVVEMSLGNKMSRFVAWTFQQVYLNSKLEEMNKERKQHWETVYETKSPEEVSWTQKTPQTSLDFIHSFGLNKSVKIIDIGGGDSNLVDHLLDAGFENITVLDISGKAIERAKTRLGERANQVTWIISDITDFKPTANYDIWHDRATFHFLTSPDQISSYKEIVFNNVSGFMCIGTFSENGPLKCSGLEIKQYTSDSLFDTFKDSFKISKSHIEDHKTPFDTFQNFIFCGFKKLSK